MDNHLLTFYLGDLEGMQSSVELRKLLCFCRATMRRGTELQHPRDRGHRELFAQN